MANVIEDKINQLQKLSEDKQRFIDNLAHELRTPLTSIIGYSDFLRTSKYDEETFLSSLTYIYEEGKRLEQLAFKLMDLILLRKENFKMKNENIKKLLLQIKNFLITNFVDNAKIGIESKLGKGTTIKVIFNNHYI